MRGIKPPKGKQKLPKKHIEFDATISTYSERFRDAGIVALLVELLTCRDFYRQLAIAKKFGEYNRDGLDFLLLIDFLLDLITAHPEFHNPVFTAIKQLIQKSSQQVCAFY
jgi:hypothetical protein